MNGWLILQLFHMNSVFASEVWCPCFYWLASWLLSPHKTTTCSIPSSYTKEDLCVRLCCGSWVFYFFLTHWTAPFVHRFSPLRPVSRCPFCHICNCDFMYLFKIKELWKRRAKNKDLSYSPFWCWLNTPSKVVSVCICLPTKETTLFLFCGWQTKPCCLYEASFLSKKPLVFLHFPVRLELPHPLRTVQNGYAGPDS